MKLKSLESIKGILTTGVEYEVLNVGHDLTSMRISVLVENDSQIQVYLWLSRFDYGELFTESLST